MSTETKSLIPGWVWGIVAVAAVGLVLGLALSDRNPEPGPSMLFDVSSYEAVDPAKILFREAARISLDLEHPTALCARQDGTILTAGEGKVLVLDASGQKVSAFTIEGAPDCLAEGPDGRLYLGMRDRIAVHDAQGQFLESWETLGPRAWITSIAVDERNFYAADAGQRVIHRLDLSGALLGKIGERDTAQDIPGFIVPSPYFDILLDPSGGLWAVNPGKHGFEHYRPDGRLISSWYRSGIDLDGFSGCCNPIHVASRGDAAVVTVEKGINRIKVYSPDTTLLGVVATPEMLGTLSDAAASCTEEALIKDIAVDSSDRILALHGPRKELLIFEALKKDG